MLRLIPLAAVLLAATPAGAAERGFAVAGFDRVRAAGPFTVKVSVGGTIGVRASGPRDALDRLSILSEGGLLRIGTEPGDGGGREIDWSKVVVQVRTPALAAASLAGSGDMTVDRARGTRFQAALTGSGDLSIGQLDAQSLAVSLTGSGTLTLAGQARSGTVSLNGSGNVAASGLTLGTAQVTLAGSGDVTVAASGTAAVSLAGSGDVTVTGRARCTVAKRGTGTVRCGA